MNRDLKLLEQRRLYVQAEISKAERASEKVAELSQKLFISERTVWYDFTAKTENTDKKT